MRALADFVYTLSWRIPGRTWRRLLAFAEAEAESALELRCAASLTTSTERAARYLKHAEDETRHARILLRRAELSRGKGALPTPRPRHLHLFAALGEAGFAAFVHRGERRGRRQFEAHVRFFAERDPAMSKALASILADERQHEAYTAALVSEFDAPDATRRAVWRDRWFRWRRAGAMLTAPVFAITMGLLFVIAAPLGWLGRRARAGWRDEPSS